MTGEQDTPSPAGFVRVWTEGMRETLRGSEGYLLIGKAVFNGLALIAALFTVVSLVGSMVSAQRQELKEESARLSEALYSEETGKRLEGLRGYGAFLRDFGGKSEAVEKARYALVDYFARWRSGRLAAPPEQKSLELQAAWRIAAQIGPKGWYATRTDGLDTRNFAWIEVARPVGWSGDADPRSLFADGAFGKVELADLDFSCLNLGRVDLVEATILHLVARAAKLGEAQLINASISNVKLQAMSARRADFSLATITESDFSTIENEALACGGAGIHSRTSDLTQAFFQDASLTGVKLAGARVDVADFTNALLSAVDFSRVSGSDVSFRNAIIDSSTFDGAALIRSDFAGAKIGRTTFDGANLAGSSLAGAKLLDSGSEESLLRAEDLERVNISGTRFSSPTIVCRLIARGAVLVTDYRGWNDAGRPARAWAFANEEDRATIRKCRDTSRKR